jgi:hypothetical protein
MPTATFSRYLGQSARHLLCYKGGSREKEFASDWKERKCSRCFPARPSQDSPPWLPVNFPSSNSNCPFTNTYFTPVDNCAGSMYVALLRIVLGSKTLMSPKYRSFKSPRSCKRSRCAGREVILRMPCSRVSKCSSRTSGALCKLWRRYRDRCRRLASAYAAANAIAGYCCDRFGDVDSACDHPPRAHRVTQEAEACQPVRLSRRRGLVKRVVELHGLGCASRAVQWSGR